MHTFNLQLNQRVLCVCKPKSAEWATRCTILHGISTIRQWHAAFRLIGLLFAKKPGIRCLTGNLTVVYTTMWPTVMQLAFCGQLVFHTSVNTKQLQADYYKEITLRYAVIVGSSADL